MDCRELVEVVTAHLEGALAREDEERFAAHLEECPFCRRYVAQVRAVVAGLGELPPEPASPRARAELLRAFAGWRTTGGAG